MLYSYDLAGNLLTSTDGNSVTTTYTYSVANQLQTATSSRSDAQDPSSLLSSVQNGPFGPLNYHLGNGINAVNSYDGLGRLNGRWVCAGNTTSANCSGGTQLDGSTATWKGVRATAVTDTYANQAYSYGYDEFNRLTSTSVGGSTTYSYAYDRWGNRTSQTPGPSATFNGSNQMTGFSYDAAGNLMKDAAGNSYSYDAEGNVTQVTGTSVGTVKYTYDGLNQRVRVDKGSSYQEYNFNQQGQRVSIWNGTTNLQGQYYLNGQTAAYYTGGSLHFQHKDWLGTERIRTTSSGSLEGRFMQLAFGDGYQVTSGSDTDDAHFASLDYDAPMQTSHAQFRELDTTHGRWMSPDPYDGSYSIFNPQSLNRYSYVLNNPLALVDPLGMEDPSGCDNGDDDDGGGCNPGGDQGDPGGDPGNSDPGGDPGNSDPGGNPSSTGIDNTANGYTLHINAYGFTGPDLNDLTSVWLSSIYSFQFNGPFTFQIGGGALSSGRQVSATPLPPSTHTKRYSDYLACAIPGLFDPDADRSPNVSAQGDDSTFVVVNSAPFIFKNPFKKVVATGVAVIYDLNLAVTNRERCVQQVYGPDYF